LLSELRAAMTELAKDERTLFVGQAVKYPGQIAFSTFDGVPMERRIEMPVCEDFQVGVCSGLALAGFVPVSFFPRWDFLIIAANQIINHLDKMPHMGWHPKVILRTAVGRNKPLDPGPQHTQDHSHAMRQLLTTIRVLQLSSPEDVLPAYRMALADPGSFIVVERQDRY
jgi:pyruvate/2-oxoglutarate/acetoin dehydrogenase E1 component